MAFVEGSGFQLVMLLAWVCTGRMRIGNEPSPSMSLHRDTPSLSIAYVRGGNWSDTALQRDSRKCLEPRSPAESPGYHPRSIQDRSGNVLISNGPTFTLTGRLRETTNMLDGNDFSRRNLNCLVHNAEATTWLIRQRAVSLSLRHMLSNSLPSSSRT